jgi:hypothetical protein
MYPDRRDRSLSPQTRTESVPVEEVVPCSSIDRVAAVEADQEVGLRGPLDDIVEERPDCPLALRLGGFGEGLSAATNGAAQM